MAIPLILLAFGSIFVGYLAKDMMIGLGTDFWSNALYTLPSNIIGIESEYIPQSQKFLPLVFTVSGALLAYLVNYLFTKQVYFFKITPIGNFFYYMFNKRWLFDKVYNDFIAQKALYFGYSISFKTLDKGSFEILGPYGISKTIQQLTKHIRLLQSGLIYHYAVIMLIGLTFFVLIVGLWEYLEFFIDNRLYFVYIISFLFYNYYSIVSASANTTD
jgi:NADH-ubiquinone oxidoreductase chain 5